MDTGGTNILMNPRFLEEEGTVTEPSHLEETTSTFIVCLELWCANDLFVVPVP